jgi:hypothetical protein
MPIETIRLSRIILSFLERLQKGIVCMPEMDFATWRGNPNASRLQGPSATLAVSIPRQDSYQHATDAIITSFGCLLVVGGLWGFGIFNGFGMETLLIFLSDLRPGLEGFVYPDQLRTFTSLFYHLSYVLGSIFGVHGSFVPYQLVYGGLWVLRAILTYGIVARLMPGRPALAMFAGLLTAMHTADGALNWVGQLNQFGFIFLMLLSFFLLLVSLDTPRRSVAAIAAIGSALAGYLSLWSYESPLPVMLAFPVAVMLLRSDVPRSRLAWTCVIYLLPVVMSVRGNVMRYLSMQGQHTYQMSVMRHDFAPAALIADLGLHLKNSVSFWNWPISIYMPPYLGSYGIAAIPIIIGIGIVTVRAVTAEARSARPFKLDWHGLLFVCIFFGFLVASCLVILTLGDNRNLWRTDFLPGFAAASLMAAAIYGVLHFIPGSALRTMLAASLILAVGVFATFAGVNSALGNSFIWERQRLLMSSILANVPDAADGTLFVLRNLSPDADTFAYNEYFTLALRLAYPGRNVVGAYFFADGSPARAMNVDFGGGKPRVRAEGMPFNLVSPPLISHVAVFDYDPSTGDARPIAAGPVTLGAAEIEFEFCGAIARSAPSPTAARRYGPISSTHLIDCSKKG